MTLRASLLLLCGLTLALGACSPSPLPTTPPVLDDPDPALPPSVARFEARSSCAFVVPQGNTPQTVRCGVVSVPQKHAEPQGKSLELAVAVFKGPAGAARKIATVFMAGGPGGDSQYLFSQMEGEYARRLLEQGDVIVFDQRGTGQSRPRLECETELRAAAALDSTQAQLEARGNCAKRWKAAGYDLSSFNTRENAADVNDLAAALGYDTLNLYGISYGTLLAQRVMRDFPGRVRSAVLDGTVSPASNFTADDGFVESVNTLLGDCKKSLRCNTAFPSLDSKLGAVLSRLGQSSVLVTVPDLSKPGLPPLLDRNGQPIRLRMDDDTFRSTLFQLLYADWILGDLPWLIDLASQGDYRLWAYFAYSDAESDFSFPWAMYHSVVCHDYYPYADLSQFSSEARNYRQSLCAAFGVGQEDRSSVTLISSKKPTLLLSGRFDPITPPRYAEQVQTRLSSARLLRFQAGSHGSVYADKQTDGRRTANCGAAAMLEFLSAPPTVRTPSCASAPLEFYVPGAGQSLSGQSVQALERFRTPRPQVPWPLDRDHALELAQTLR